MKEWLPQWMHEMERKYKRKPNSPVWTTATGERIRVCDMDNGHLVNTIRYLEMHVGYPDYFDDGKGNTLDPFADYEFEPPPIYHDMKREAKRRGIDVANFNPRVATLDEFNAPRDR